MRRTVLPALGLILLPFATRAQRPLAERIRAAGTMTVAFEARSRPEVCGDGTTSYNDGLSPQRARFYDGYTLVTHEPWDTHIPPCEKGPVRVTVRVVDGKPSWLRVAAGPLATLGDTVTDLGAVSVTDARAFLEPLVTAADGRASLEAIMPVVLIDSVPRWDILQRVARDSTRVARCRRRAADLLARGAANTIAPEPNVDDDTRSTRREAVYALARQQPRTSDVIPDLLTIAKSNPHRDARVAALYQLGQMADARAVDLFTTMLRGQP
jgi:hypothetical protein